MDSGLHKFKYIATVHYVPKNNAFSLTPTPLKVQEKILLNSIHVHFVAIKALPKGYKSLT